jgi:hypothetical protein
MCLVKQAAILTFLPRPESRLKPLFDLPQGEGEKTGYFLEGDCYRF